MINGSENINGKYFVATLDGYWLTPDHLWWMIYHRKFGELDVPEKRFSELSGTVINPQDVNIATNTTMIIFKFLIQIGYSKFFNKIWKNELFYVKRFDFQFVECAISKTYSNLVASFRHSDDNDNELVLQ